MKMKVIENSLNGVQTESMDALQALTQRKMRSFEEAFTLLMQATGISDLNALVTKFIRGEEQNFAMFKFVNELNSENENLEIQIIEMQSEIDRNAFSHHSYKRRELMEQQRAKVKPEEEDDEAKRTRMVSELQQFIAKSEVYNSNDIDSKQVRRDSKTVHEMAEDLQQKFLGKGASNEEDSSMDSDDADLFSVPMN